VPEQTRRLFPRYGPRICRGSDGEQSDRRRNKSSILSGSSNRFNYPNTERRLLSKQSLFKWCSCIWEEHLSLPARGTEPWDSQRDWRLGLAERTESVWDSVGRGDRSSDASERVVRGVNCDLNKSHDGILIFGRSRRRGLGKWYREVKLEMSTFDTLLFSIMNDSTLIGGVSSPLVMTEEMTELRSSALELSI
jgi:hypothetical protein